MTTIQIIANVISAIGMFLLAISTIFKNKKGILIIQSVAQVFTGTSFILLQAYSGACVCLAVIIISVFTLLDKQNNKLNIFFLTLIIVLGVGGIIIDNITSNTKVPLYLNLVSILPIISNFEYNFIVLYSKNSTFYIRIGFLISCILWVIYNFFYKNYSGVGFNLLSVVISIISIIVYKNKLNKESKLNADSINTNDKDANFVDNFENK